MTQYGFMFDMNRCYACQACSIACKDWHGIEPGADENNLAEGDMVTATQSAVVLENLIGQFLYGKAEEGASSNGGTKK